MGTPEPTKSVRAFLRMLTMTRALEDLWGHEVGTVLNQGVCRTPLAADRAPLRRFKKEPC